MKTLAYMAKGPKNVYLSCMKVIKKSFLLENYFWLQLGHAQPCMQECKILQCNNLNLWAPQKHCTHLQNAFLPCAIPLCSNGKVMMLSWVLRNPGCRMQECRIFAVQQSYLVGTSQTLHTFAKCFFAVCNTAVWQLMQKLLQTWMW